MLSPAARVGDATIPHSPWSGGVLTAGSPDTNVNGIPVCRVGDPGTPHTHPDNPPHGVAISGGSATVFVNGLPLARVGDPTSCGSAVGSGSGNVSVG